MRIVVTGGAGFIGSHACRELAARPEVTRVVALDDFSTGDPANLDGTAVEIVHGSILDGGLLDRTLAAADAVVHLAARPSVPRSLADPMASHQVNATGTVRVLEACRRGGVHVIAVSSSSVYGAVRELPKHEDLPTRPLSPYAASKLATESYSLAYAAAFGLPVLVLRFFNVYGPFQPAGHAYAAVVPAFIDAALRGRPLRVHGDGHQTRDFTYVGTVAQVLADAAVRRVAHDTPVNLAFGTRVSILDVAKLLSDLVGRPLPTRHEPGRAGDVRDSQADDRRLRTLFPDLRPVPLEAGLEETVSWFHTLPGYR
ncbi:NAD-dependent epimerase/dehydratase family protein [Actinomadura sp. WMMA1423]|uniref:NAD-dependent epimerase/dehydratase family protein n=1 Tax=Actinomadura sp. WMMA1423 TaxID=2591108 RepID=UPI0011469EFE|nr:NAD-dependent epimerase/dehydratase family protein [Actinomadura sp. WMMA1423]